MLSMNKRLFNLFLLLFCMVLTGCSGSPVTKSVVVLDAESFTNAGIEAFSRAEWKQAKTLFNRALSLYQGIDDQQGVLYNHINLAEVALSINDFPSVQRHLGFATEIAKNNPMQEFQARIRLLYALEALKQKKTTQAETILQPLLPEFDRLIPTTVPDEIQMAAIANRTKIAFIQKLDEQFWIQRYANALKLLANKKPELEARLLRFQANLSKRQGDFEESESKLQKALTEYKKNLFRTGIAETLFELGQLYKEQSLWQQAKNYFNRSLDVFRYQKNLAKVNQLTEILDIVETQLGDLESDKILK